MLIYARHEKIYLHLRSGALLSMYSYEYSPKKTFYNGTWYRSRLEATWACMFDKLNISFQYEPIDLKGWSPDFRVKDYLIEVKPQQLLFEPTVLNKTRWGTNGNMDNVVWLTEYINQEENQKNIFTYDKAQKAISYGEIFCDANTGNYIFRSNANFSDILPDNWRTISMTAWMELWKGASGTVQFQIGSNG